MNSFQSDLEKKNRREIVRYREKVIFKRNCKTLNYVMVRFGSL